ncbi:Os11g0703500 [Oryza sativa Japonica Group]|uniref:Os11g0703500 protein n=4 Tax=Oryza TaxID=4527 RepID=B9G8V9_ORYSJ|nr:hypothetical protein OsI_37062 [Oryza sativa Indica Group]EEE52574.1 hypothetical protein OsJ_34850 [Oryza sativa Japonica Group]BAF28901.1 Os11g0703500 [Oryza sativa Japonica Group]BAT15390.1 Os11g0703500 [Oryza sativa Japonica Group]|eukprot:NP_001068538.1 Os11g0703500 [Oryza sativa Japonica Group]
MHTQLSISIGDSSEELSELIQCISCLVISSPHHKQQQLPGKNKQQQQLVIDEEENRGWLVGFQHKLADCCLHLPNQQTF